MKKHVLFVGFLFLSCTVWAQNKTLGVGVTTPNPNAALHVESPTANQGFILPRLTTAQRTATTFLSALGPNDDGLLVYDLDEQSIFIWDGTAWTSNADVNISHTGAGNASTFAVNNAANQGAAIYATTNGTIGATTIQSAAILAETSTAFSAITAHVPPGAGQSNAISGITKSTDPGSWAGFFSAETGTAVYATTKSNVGGAVSPVAVYGESLGTGSNAAAFRINNAANSFPSVFSETNGTGGAGFFNQTNLSTFTPALIVRTNGQGAAIAGTATASSTNANASEFVVASAVNPRFAVRAETIGTGSAGYFFNNNVANTFSALVATTNGLGAGVQAETSTGFTALWAKRDGPSNGNAGLFDITNATNNYSALQVNTVGTGAAANFQVTNGSSSAPAIYAQTNGVGAAISADNTNTGDAFFADKTGSLGSAGNFQINNPSNANAALFGLTSAPNGTAIGAINSGNGNAIALFNGGLKMSTFTLSGGTSITTRAAAYLITGGGPYTFSLTPGLGEGEIYFFFNSTVASVTVNSISLPAGSGQTFIYLGGALRAMTTQP